MTEDKGQYLAVQDFGREQIELIKRTVAKGTTDDELALFLHQARRTGLDPLSKQIHAVMRWNDKDKRSVMSIQVAIDGYRLIADRTGKYAGSDDYLFDEGLTQFQHLRASALHPSTATVTVYKLVGNLRCPFTATAEWTAYHPGDKQGFMWKKMPHLMLGKCAEALALRKAFPAELSGVYTNDEMMQAGEIVEPSTGAGAKASAQAVAQANTDPDMLDKARAYFAATNDDGEPISDKQVELLASKLAEAISGGDVERHLFLEQVCGVGSTRELGKKQASKLLEFLLVKGTYNLNPEAVQKAQALMRQIHLAQGQQGLLLDARPADVAAEAEEV